MGWTLTAAWLALGLATTADAPPPPAGPRPFVITVVDEQTGRGVPLVELRTVNEQRFWTDSAGVAALVEPGLFGQSVYFHVKSHGYEFAKDGFGYRGKALDVTEGGAATLKIRRLNVAERLYRVTGGGIYRDSVLAGRTPPTKEPLLNARVLGSDSVLNAVYRGKLHWFWGDTNRPSYPLGNFHTPGAVSDLPGRGGLDPEVGVNLTYFQAPDGFAAETAHLPGDGPTWLGGLVVVKDGDGAEQLVAGYAKIKPPLDTYEHGLVVFDPDAHRFHKVATFPLDAPIRPTGHTDVARDDGVDYVYYLTPYPLMRVRADLAAMKDIHQYEAYTCLATGTRLDKTKPPTIDRDASGKARYAWRRDTPALNPADFARLVREKVLTEDEVLLPLRDVETGKPVLAHGGTVTWNAHRKRWVLIALEFFGTSLLGEVWYAEADTPLGPWAYARKVVTHDKYSFYNPRQHPYFDGDGGRVIFFEGTYTTSFSGSTDPTPRYEYNQVLYRLDLDDPRLNLPVPVYRLDDGTHATGSAHAGAEPAGFFALERPGEGASPVYASAPKGDTTRRLTIDRPAAGEGARPAAPVFYVRSAAQTGPAAASLTLVEDGTTAAAPRSPDGPKALGRVWPAPTRVRFPPPR